jgi:hypothetical protein
MNRRDSAALMLGHTNLLAAAPKKRMVVYKSPSCGCCNGWVRHVQAAGYQVETHDVEVVTPYKEKYGVPLDLASCHTAVVAGYAIEGHVPADVIDQLLREKPKQARALIVPGMPVGSPGMEMGGRKDAYQVILVDTRGNRRVYAKR